MGTSESSLEKTLSKMEDQLKLWGAKLHVLGAKGEVVGESVKIESRKHVDELKAKLAIAQSKLQQAKAAGSDKWDAFKLEVERYWEELETAFQRLVH